MISVELMPKKVRAGIADLYGEVQQWTEKEIIVETEWTRFSGSWILR